MFTLTNLTMTTLKNTSNQEVMQSPKKGEKPKAQTKEFEFQKEAINEILADAINRHGYNKVLKVLENTSFKT